MTERNVGISREQARVIAETHLKQEGSALGGNTVREVLNLSEVSRQPTLYGGVLDQFPDSWIAYVDRPGLALSSSVIVVVTRLTGDVIYAGSANDEG